MTRTWTITDTALDAIDQHLARPAPERGGILIGPPNTRLVTELLLDPVDGDAAEYSHSRQLRALQQQRLHADPTVTYRGSIHSHPAFLAAPSGPDRVAFTSALRRNPALGDLLFPIVVGSASDDLDPKFRGDHLVEMRHGTLAAFSAHLDGAHAHVAPASIAMLPVGQLARTIAAAQDWTLAGISPTTGPADQPWIRIVWATPDGGPAADALIPVGFPLAAPLLRTTGDERFTGGPWAPGARPDQQILDELRRRQGTDRITHRPRPTLRHKLTGLLGRLLSGPGAAGPTARQATSVDDLRTQLHARTAHHLPTRADWHVAVLGVGSVGSVMAEAFVRSGIPTITLVDPEPVEGVNLSRTVYVADDIGSPKVDALTRRLKAISPSVAVTTAHQSIAHWLPNADIRSFDLIVLATDDALAESAVNQAAYPAAVPLVSVKLFAKADAGEILIVHPDSSGPCLQCLTGRRAAPAGRTVDYGSGRLVAELALGPDIHTVANQAVKISLALLVTAAGPGPLTEWITPLLAQQRLMLLTATNPNWGPFSKLDAAAVGLDGPYQSLWIPLAQRDPTCPICGATTTETSRGGRALSHRDDVPPDGDPWSQPPESATQPDTEPGPPASPATAEGEPT